MRVTRSVVLPISEIELRFSRSSGPGGQHANTSETRVEAILDVELPGPLGCAETPCLRQGRTDASRNCPGRAQPVTEPRAGDRAPRRAAAASPEGGASTRRDEADEGLARTAARDEEKAVTDEEAAKTARGLALLSAGRRRGEPPVLSEKRTPRPYGTRPCTSMRREVRTGVVTLPVAASTRRSQVMVGKPRRSAAAARVGHPERTGGGDDVDSARADLDRRLNSPGFRIELKQVCAAAGHPERPCRPRASARARRRRTVVRRRGRFVAASIWTRPRSRWLITQTRCAAEDEVGGSVAHGDSLRHPARDWIDADDLAGLVVDRPERAGSRPRGCTAQTPPSAGAR